MGDLTSQASFSLVTILKGRSLALDLELGVLVRLEPRIRHAFSAGLGALDCVQRVLTGARLIFIGFRRGGSLGDL